MDELLQRVAEIKGMPASLVERSAKARAEKTGTTLEAVLREWAGESTAHVPPSGGTPEERSDDAGGVSEPASRPATEPDTPAEVTIDSLVALAADAKRMPAKLILSSATARAEHSDSSLEEVLADWAGIDLEALRAQSTEHREETEVGQVTGDRSQVTEEERPTGDSPQPSEEEESKSVAAAASVAAVALSMDELLEKVTEVKGMPASLAKRSAEARSKKTGESVEAVLAEWAGIELEQPSDVSPQPSEEEQPSDVSPQPSEEEPKAEVEVIEASSVVPPEPPEEGDAAPLVRGGYPRWLAAAFVLIPLIAVIYILIAPNGPDCGSASQLLVDPVTGQAVNCDRSEYGVAAVDFFADGAALYIQCAACHAGDGTGGAGVAFIGGGLLSTFPGGSCDKQIEFIRLGTAGWPDPTYGATGKPVGGFGLMPTFGGTMTDEQLAAVALYERVEFGGQLLEEAELDCGLDEGDGTAEAAAP